MQEEKLVRQVHKAMRERRFRQAIQIIKQPGFPVYWKPQLLREIAQPLTTDILHPNTGLGYGVRVEREEGFLQLAKQICGMPELEEGDRLRILSQIARLLAKEHRFDEALQIMHSISQSYQGRIFSLQTIASQAIKHGEMKIAQQTFQQIKKTDNVIKNHIYGELVLKLIRKIIDDMVEDEIIRDIFRFLKTGQKKQDGQKQYLDLILKYITALDETRRDHILYHMGMKMVHSDLPFARQIHQTMRDVQQPSGSGRYKIRDYKAKLLQQILSKQKQLQGGGGGGGGGGR